jgi:Collagen triple helix repeat (20 copies)
MFSRIRKRITYANAAMTLALVFAMSGGAYAASKYLITSTKQISPKVLKALKGKTGPAGPAGPAGAAGVGTAGAQGAAGAKGEPGKEGEKGKEGVKGETGKEGVKGIQGVEGKQGIQGIQGVEGSPWTAGGTLPSGKTETGTWGLAYKVPAGEPIHREAISFPIPLATEAVAPVEDIIGVEEGEGEPKEKKPFPKGCKGKVAKPEAVKGSLCVFIGFVGGAGELTLTGVLNPINSNPTTATTGAMLNFGTKEGLALAEGTWAVTAE